MRRTLNCRAVGHAGTLDPFATGLLVVLVGRATRLARFVERRAKLYRADITLGTATDTDDVTGRVIAERVPPVWPAEDRVLGALHGLVGTYLQRPPAYSARKIGGERAHAIARAGGVPALAPREVTVHSIELVRWTAPVATVLARVSAGTYIRALARDLGERLDLAAHCSALRRESIGPFQVDDALPPDGLSARQPLLSPLALLGDMPRVELDSDGTTAVVHGRPVPAAAGSGVEAALVADGRLIAVAEGREGWWHPRVVLEAA